MERYEIVCPECEAEYIVLTTEPHPEYCPYCSFYNFNDEEQEEDEDSED